MGKVSPVAQRKSFSAELLVEEVEGRSPRSQGGALRAVRETQGMWVELHSNHYTEDLKPVRRGQQERLP